jgi:hypothetical protein
MIGLDSTTQVCRRCAETRRTCPSCVQRRRFAGSLVNERGETLETAARIMMLAPERVRQLVDQETDRRDLERFRCDSIPVELTKGGHRRGASPRSRPDDRADRRLARHVPERLRALIPRQEQARESETAGERLQRQPADDRARASAERAARLLTDDSDLSPEISAKDDVSRLAGFPVVKVAGPPRRTA